MKKFICKHKKLLMVCLFALLVSSLCFGTLMTASAWKISTSYTVVYRDSNAAVQPSKYNLSYSELTALDVKGTQETYAMTVNGQYYNYADTATALTVENELLVSSVKPDTEQTESSDNITYLYYRIVGSGADYVAVSCSPEKSGSKYTVSSLRLTNPAIYEFCTVNFIEDTVLDEITLVGRSSFFTITLEVDIPINSLYTVEYGTDTPITSTTSLDYNDIYQFEQSDDEEHNIVINGQIYEASSMANKTLTVNKLVAGTFGDDYYTDGSGFYYGTNLYYCNGDETFFSYADTRTTLLSNTVKVYSPLVITEAGTYVLCIVEESYDTAADEPEYSYTRSAFITVVVNPSFQIPVPEKTGYTFTGWYTDEACTNLFEEDYFSSDMVLYAGFRLNQYTIVFNGNGHTSGSMANQVCEYSKTYSLESNSFTKTGYEFLGWSQSQTATTATYQDGGSITNLSTEDGATVTLFAVWKASTYTVIFQGPTSSVKMTCSIDQEYTVYDGSALTKEGHTLIGYSYQNGNGAQVEFALGEKFINIAQAGETVYLYTCFDVNQIYITFIIPGFNGEEDEVITIEVDWGTPTTDVISQNVDSLLLEVEDGQELPN